MKYHMMGIGDDSLEGMDGPKPRKPVAYLTGVEVGKGMFSNESSVSFTDTNGKKHSGFFYKDMILDGALEVQVLHTDEKLALIRPTRGQEFLEVRGITVPKSRLRYVG